MRMVRILIIVSYKQAAENYDLEREQFIFKISQSFLDIHQLVEISPM